MGVTEFARSNASVSASRSSRRTLHVYCADADQRAGKLSVSSSIGTAILGYREGDALDRRIGGRTSRIQIAGLLYQPEAAGDFHL